MKKTLRIPLVALLVSGACGLTSCTPPNVPDPQKQAQEQVAADKVVTGVLGNATPAPSPEAKDPAGTVLQLPAAFAAAKDVDNAGDVFAVRSGNKLAIGSIDKLRTNSFTTLDIMSSCGDITVTGDTFVLPCPVPIEGGAGGGAIYLIDAKNPNLEDSRRASMKFTSAAMTSTGEVIGGSSEEPDVYVFRGKDSGDSKKISTGRKADQMVASAVSGTRDGVVFIDRAETAIQGVDYQNNRPGAALRMGVGVGSIAAGEEGLFLASDALGDQFGVYTDDDILMLHQTMRTDKSPWAIAWDKKHNLAWVSSTADNTITAYSLKSGVPEKRGSFSSIADVHSMSIDADGNIYALSSSGAGLQVIPAKDVAAAVDKPAQP
ncbi:WD40 repeat domain-containing protein [Corynebacterium sp. H128]|uniref:WD40 repeat domain-containing protein n=1 Tax=Corynebacterium sp. H128 TaxID=3133427 RepID=UPI0030B5E4D4